MTFECSSGRRIEEVGRASLNPGHLIEISFFFNFVAQCGLFQTMKICIAFYILANLVPEDANTPYIQNS